MGNRFRESSLFNKTAMSQIGTISICPNCQESFPPTTTFQNFDQHVTDCLQNFRPTDQQRKRMQRRKKSKDSNGSEDNGQKKQQLDQTTVEVYIKKTDYTNSQNYKQKVMIGKKTEDNQTDNKQNRKFIPKKSYWVKSKLTFYQSILYSMQLPEVSKHGSPYKILWFHNKLESMKISWKFGPEHLAFHPEQIVEHSYKILNMSMYKQLKLTVLNDVVHDAGGLLREWIGMLLKDLIERYKLFIRNSAGFYILNPELSSIESLNKKVRVVSEQKVTLSDKIKEKNFTQEKNNQVQDEDFGYINQNQKMLASIQKEFLYFNNSALTYKDLYELFSVILAKAIIQKVTIVPSFDRMFIHSLISREFFEDENLLDRLYTYNTTACQTLFYLEELNKNLKNEFLYEKSLQQLKSLCLTFSIRQEPENIDYDLVPNGSQILIETQNQLTQYIQKYKQYYLHQKHKNQQILIRKKFLQIIKPEMFNGLFSCEEFQLILNGVDGNNIDIKDWQQGTVYKQPFHANHKTIKYFWSAVGKMSPHHRMRLFKFVTGAERLPVYGFKNLQTNRGQTSCFTIQSMKYDKKLNQFPKAHTCFNRLVLPLYPSQESLMNGLNAIVNSEFDGVWGMQ